MKVIKLSQHRKVISTALSFLILFTSCTNSSSDDSVNRQNLTGENLFRAIFFKQGELADRVYKGQLESELDNNVPSSVNLNEITQIQDLIVKTIDENNPNFFIGFESKIRSNDVLKIEEAMVNGGELILETLLFLDKDQSLSDNVTFQSFLKAYDSKDLSTVDQQALLLYLVAVFAIAVYLAVYLWDSSGNSRKGGDNYNRLYKEALVHNIYELVKEEE